MDLAAIEKELILQALKKHNGNQTRAARYLKMSRRALGYRLEKYGLPGGSEYAEEQRRVISRQSAPMCTYLWRPGFGFAPNRAPIFDSRKIGFLNPSFHVLFHSG